MNALETECTVVNSALSKSAATWKVAAAQKRGVSHEESDLHCQDAMAIAMPFPDTLVIAVADGAGSAKDGLAGATLAVNSSTKQLCTQLTAEAPFDDAKLEALLADALGFARNEIEAAATASELDIHDLATTLILVIARPDLIAATQVGDGATVIVDESGRVMGLTLPIFGEYINETTFITSADSLEDPQIRIWHGENTGLAVFTDGLQLLCLSWPDCQPSRGFFSPLFRFVEDSEDAIEAGQNLMRFLGSRRIRELTDDDLTLVLAARTKDSDES
jgi:hypothetical protein